MQPTSVSRVRIASSIAVFPTADPPQYKSGGRVEVALSSDASPLGGSYGELRGTVLMVSTKPGSSAAETDRASAVPAS